jgi:hypothetical protein
MQWSTWHSHKGETSLYVTFHPTQNIHVHPTSYIENEKSVKRTKTIHHASKNSPRLKGIQKGWSNIQKSECNLDIFLTVPKGKVQCGKFSYIAKRKRADPKISPFDVTPSTEA